MKTIERLKKLLEVATTGPVLVDHDERPDGSDHLIQDCLVRPQTIAFGTSNGNENDLPLIAESWNALPALLAVVEAAVKFGSIFDRGTEAMNVGDLDEADKAESEVYPAHQELMAALRALEGRE